MTEFLSQHPEMFIAIMLVIFLCGMLAGLFLIRKGR